MSGKRIASKSKKPIALIISLLLLLSAVFGVSIAYLTTGSSEIKNTFTLGEVSCEVVEKNDVTAKSDVYVKNTGDAAAYIRAAIIVTWQDKTGNVYAKKPTSADYQITLGSGWTEKDGFYYYGSEVAVGGQTTNLISSCSQKATANIPDGYTLHVEVLAQAIQSNAVDYAWGNQ